MSETVTVWVGPDIIYLYGTINGEAATFTLIGGGYWQAIVTKSGDSTYAVYLEAYSELGLEGTYSYTLYYGMMPLVTDRKAADVARVYYFINKGWAAMTTEEREEWLAGLKGTYNHSDLNRVGAVSKYLADQLQLYGYAVDVSAKTDWAVGDIPDASEMTLYIANLEALKAAFYGTVSIPASMDSLNYIGANNIELLLEEIYTYIIRMIDGYRKCGTYKAGQGVILP